MQNNNSPSFDILIVGAGLVGNSLALALADTAKVAIVEASPLDRKSPSDERALALSFSTQRILAALEVWPLIQPHSTAIQQVHVSEVGHLGATRFSATDYEVDALGYTITAQRLTDVLQDRVLKKPTIQHFYASTLERITPIPSGYRVHVQTPEGTRIFTTRLLVGADGAQSHTRQLLGIASKQVDYEQVALTARMILTRTHKHIAYERFSENAVLATLPMPDNEVAIVWTVDTSRADMLKKLTDTDFCAQFQSNFGYRLGQFTQVEKRSAYPVRRLQALEQIRPHAVLLGNAAHTLHPVAAQGFNLSLRDVAVLAQTIMDAMANGQNPGNLSVLEQYMDRRKTEQLQTMGFTEGVIRSFSKKTIPWRLLKRSGLLGLEIVPFAKHKLAQQAMGISDEMPRWVIAFQVSS